MASHQELMLRSHLINGESLYEMMVGAVTGVVRWSPIFTLENDTAAVLTRHLSKIGPSGARVT